MSSHYASKLLLFGEYAVIAGGDGLAIPYEKFSAQWKLRPEAPGAFYPHLIQFHQWLIDIGAHDTIDLQKMGAELHGGLDLESDIPIGYGVGSSGAVVAAVYDRFGIDKIQDNKLSELKTLLASMENFFHSTSSGLDPLVCYLNTAIHTSSTTINTIVLPDISDHITFSLIDCGNARSTQKLVAAFKEKMATPDFFSALQEYISISNQCIASWLDTDIANLNKNLRQLSAWQYHYFDFLIPPPIKNLWRDALRSGKEMMKLCGAGGGGFMIRFSMPD